MEESFKKRKNLRKFSAQTDLSSTNLHKQFTMDRIANFGKFDGRKLELSERFYWRFHKWKPRRHNATKKNQVLSNGFPMHSQVKLAGPKTYLDIIKEIFAEPPADSAFTERKFKPGSEPASKEPPIHGTLSPEQMKEIFENPLFDKAQGDIDDYLMDMILKKAGFSQEFVDNLKTARRWTDRFNDAQDKVSEYLDFLPEAEMELNIDLEEYIPDDLRKKVDDAAKDFAIDLDLRCDDD